MLGGGCGLFIWLVVMLVACMGVLAGVGCGMLF